MMLLRSRGVARRRLRRPRRTSGSLKQAPTVQRKEKSLSDRDALVGHEWDRVGGDPINTHLEMEVTSSGNSGRADLRDVLTDDDPVTN